MPQSRIIGWLKLLAQSVRREDEDPISDTLAFRSLIGLPVPRPDTLHFQLSCCGDELEMRRRKSTVGETLFILAFAGMWLTAWTYGCFLLGQEIVRHPSLRTVLIAAALYGVLLLFACLLLSFAFGRERLHVSPAGLDYEFRVIVPVVRRQIALEDVTGIGGFPIHERGGPYYGIIIHTAGKPIRIGKRLPLDELIWLADVLRRHIAGLLAERG